ncbi:hypothetical protein [Coleofasciculus sp. FACHB-129]|uniref:hypothetical protein n=1 Tax=Cyanophyceae TaxID=3028117 RepID=UPI0016830976|nr:hypothetical protein [Coleofasciculus sp. FACHB-129]MBD1896596.1 hypothetical protein [Coleofasciculus sp. FACHB-129]
MTTLFCRIQPSKTFRLTVALLAKYLKIPESFIVRFACWQNVLFVHRTDRGGQFVSYRQLRLWWDAIALLFQTCHTPTALQQLGLQIKEESHKFSDYYQEMIEDLRQLWTKRRDYIISLPKSESAA